MCISLNATVCLMSFPLSSSDKHINQACWMLPCDRRDLLQRSNHHQVKGQKRGDVIYPISTRISSSRPDEIKEREREREKSWNITNSINERVMRLHYSYIQANDLMNTLWPLLLISQRRLKLPNRAACRTLTADTHRLRWDWDCHHCGVAMLRTHRLIYIIYHMNDD